MVTRHPKPVNVGFGMGGCETTAGQGLREGVAGSLQREPFS